MTGFVSPKVNRELRVFFKMVTTVLIKKSFSEEGKKSFWSSVRKARQ